MSNIDPGKGKNLEFEVINKLKSGKWGDFRTGYFYRDLIADKPTEIDAVTIAIFPADHKSIQVTLFLEIKYLTGNMTVWTDKSRWDDLVKYYKSNLVTTDDGVNSLKKSKLFYFREVARTWFQNTESRKEGFYEAVSKLLPIVSSQGIKNQFDHIDSSIIKRLSFPVIIYRSENPIEFRDFDNQILQGHSNDFILEIHDIHPNKMSAISYLKDTNYIFVWNINNVEARIKEMTTEFWYSGLNDWYPGNLISTLIEEYKARE